MKKKFVLFFFTALWLNITFGATPLPVDDAFQFSAHVKNASTIVLEWKIHPGYYLYKDRFSYKIVNPESTTASNLLMPPGIPKEDDLLGQYEVYDNQLQLALPLKKFNKTKPLDLKVCFQGCSKEGFCYPAETKYITLDLTDTSGKAVTGKSVSTIVKISEQEKITQLLASNNSWLILISFLGFGFLLALTPCVLPMIPILSGLILSHTDTMTTRRAFLLSFVYVLGMAITYAIAGVAAGFAGQSIQATMQLPWVIVLFSLVFILLSLSLFGFYELRLPASIQDKLVKVSDQQRKGNYLGVAFMGILSSLIVSPCITPPLVGALAYISQTGNSILGGFALLALGLGMGIPLIIVGTSGGKLLPKAGPWMEAIKAFFGVLLLATAIWLLQRVIPAQITMLLWASLMILSAIYMGLLSPHKQHGWGNFWRGIGLLMAIYGTLLIIGAAMGNIDPLQPLVRHHQPIQQTTLLNNNVKEAPLFRQIKSNSDFDKELQQAIDNKKITLLDFYAEWCIACKDMEKKVFSDPDVRKLLVPFHVLQANITANDLVDQTLQERFQIIAPPAILFFDENGNELTAYRIVGEMNRDAFIEHIKELQLLNS